MWSGLLLTDAASEVVSFSGLTVVPAGDPIALLEAINRAGAEHALVAAPRALAAELAVGLTVATGGRPDLRLSSLVSDHAPLAILSALASAQSTTEHPVLGVALVRRLLEKSWSGAWTGSVAGLTRPAPTLSQHVRSMLPGAGFLLRQAPAPAVLGHRRDDDVPAAGLERVLLVEQGAVPGPIAERLAQTAEVIAVRQVSLPGRWISVYGTDRTGQLALTPADPRPLLSPITHQCPACLLQQVGPGCPFCRVLGRSAVPAAPGTRLTGGHS